MVLTEHPKIAKLIFSVQRVHRGKGSSRAWRDQKDAQWTLISVSVGNNKKGIRDIQSVPKGFTGL